MQAYLDESRATDPYALPDLSIEHQEWITLEYQGETHRFDGIDDALDYVREVYRDGDSIEINTESGYYAAICLPGCLPDSDWSGPYDSEDDAMQEMRELYGDDF